jgi:hypothetical protein
MGLNDRLNKPKPLGRMPEGEGVVSRDSKGELQINRNQHILLRKSPWVDRAEKKELPAKEMTNG